MNTILIVLIVVVIYLIYVSTPQKENFNPSSISSMMQKIRSGANNSDDKKNTYELQSIQIPKSIKEKEAEKATAQKIGLEAAKEATRFFTTSLNSYNQGNVIENEADAKKAADAKAIVDAIASEKATTQSTAQKIGLEAANEATRFFTTFLNSNKKGNVILNEADAKKAADAKAIVDAIAAEKTTAQSTEQKIAREATNEAMRFFTTSLNSYNQGNVIVNEADAKKAADAKAIVDAMVAEKQIQ
jgi:Holliday junction resolvase